MKRRATYSPDEVAEIGLVTRRTVYNWISSGHLPAFKVGPKLWAVHADVVQAFFSGGDAVKVHEKLQARQSAPVPVVDRKPTLSKRPVKPVAVARQLAIEEHPDGTLNQDVLPEVAKDHPFPASWPRPGDKMPLGLSYQEECTFRWKQNQIAQWRFKQAQQQEQPQQPQAEAKPKTEHEKNTLKKKKPRR